MKKNIRWTMKTPMKWSVNCQKVLNKVHGKKRKRKKKVFMFMLTWAAFIPWEWVVANRTSEPLAGGWSQCAHRDSRGARPAVRSRGHGGAGAVSAARGCAGGARCRWNGHLAPLLCHLCPELFGFEQDESSNSHAWSYDSCGIWPLLFSE